MNRSTSLVRGTVAGFVATLVMSGVMALARGLKARGEAPPRAITRAGIKALGLRAPRAQRLDAIATLLHFTFGAGMGVIYEGLLRGRCPSPAIRGSLFGLGVWISSYAGWIPWAGIMPPPWRDKRSRVVTMVAGHVAYGVTLAALSALAAHRARPAARLQAQLLPSTSGAGRTVAP